MSSLREYYQDLGLDYDRWSHVMDDAWQLWATRRKQGIGPPKRGRLIGTSVPVPRTLKASLVRLILAPLAFAASSRKVKRQKTPCGT